MNARSFWRTVTGALLLAPCIVQAAIVVYTSQSAFLSAVGNSAIDTFNDLGIGESLATPQSRTAGSYGYTASVGPDSNFLTAGDLPGDTWLSTNVLTDLITFSGFGSEVRGVGGFFFGTDIAGNSTPGASLTVTALDASGSLVQALLNPSPSSFLGFVSDGAFNALTVSAGGPGAWATVNDLTIGAAPNTGGGGTVPEPSSALMALLGLGLLASQRRRG